MTYSSDILRLPDDLKRAVTLLEQGECVALPTETVYGLAADASRPDAICKIFAAKGRPANHPLIVHVPDADAIDHWAVNVCDQARALARTCWPGPLSLLFDKHPDVPDEVTGGHNTIVLRAPAHPVFQTLLRETGLGLAAPSANRYQFLSPTTAQHVLRSLDGRIAAVVDGGPARAGIESTIAQVTEHGIRLLRPGPVSVTQIQAITGLPILADNTSVPVVPGSVKRHYQPVTPATLASADQIAAAVAGDEDIAVLSYSAVLASLPLSRGWHQHLPATPADYASRLYDALHALDMSGSNRIVIEMPPQDDTWVAVNDRLRRCVAR
ncbi:L-threonylcarbamoyladenylate synthase [Alteromonas sp. CYL-A6]|uniref:L-threonylcarbamoyladenylate synthase n=1 Tax=Alteromonas nitratireducens TaxID=3390813 RepID=UPI0034B724D6